MEPFTGDPFLPSSMQEQKRKPSAAWKCVVLAGVIFACSGGQDNVSSVPGDSAPVTLGTVTPSARFPGSEEWPVEIHENKCSDSGGGSSGSCPEGFLIDELLVSVNCIAVPTHLVTSRVIAIGEIQGEMVEVREVVGVEPEVLAVTNAGRSDCPGPEWLVVASVPAEGYERFRQALCAVGEMNQEQAEANGCDRTP